MPGNTVETVLRFRHDRQAANEVLRDNARVDASLNDVRAAAERTADAYTEMEGAAERTARAQQDAADAGVRAAKEQANIYGDLGRRSTQLAGLASQISPLAGQKLMLVNDLLDAAEGAKVLKAQLPQLAEQFGLTGVSAKQLTVGLGAAGLAVGALALGVKLLSEANEEAARKTRAQIAAIGAVDFTTVVTLPSDEVQKLIDAQTDLRDETVRDIVNLGLLEDGMREGFNSFEQLREALGANIDGVEGVEGQLKTLYEEWDKQQAIIDELTRILNSGVLAANDAAIAEEKLAEQRAESSQKTLALLDQQAAYELDLRRKVATYSVDQVTKETEELVRQREVELNTQDRLNAALEAGTITGKDYLAAMAESFAAEKQLNIAIADNNTLVLDAAKRRKEEADLIEANKKSWDALKKALGGVLDTVAEAGKALLEAGDKINQGAEIIAKSEFEREQVAMETAGKIADSEAKAAAQRVADQQRFNEQATERAAQQAERIATIEADRDAALRDMQNEFRRDERKRARDHDKEIARDREDHNDTIRGAAARLDAIAIWQERQDFQKDQRRKEQDFNEETREKRAQYRRDRAEQRQAFADRLRDAQKSYQQQETAQRVAFDRQRQQQAVAHAQELAGIQAAGQARLTALQTQQMRDLAALFGYHTTEYQVRASHYQTLYTQMQTWWGSMESIIPSPVRSPVFNTPGAVGSPAIGKGFGVTTNTATSSSRSVGQVQVNQSFAQTLMHPAQLDTAIRNALGDLLSEIVGVG